MIRLITDSPSDVPAADREKYNITVMPVPITVDGVTYRETIDFTPEEYYKILVNAKELPTHAQITMMEFAAKYQECIDEGADSIIVVTITSKGSGIYNAACLARKLMFEESPELESRVTIDIVDSGSYAWAYGHAVVDGGKAIAEGKSREEVLAAIQHSLDSYFATVGFTNLSYAKRSGRITTVAAFVGEVMGFRPILVMEDGELKTKTKVRGDSKLIDGMAQLYFDKAVEDGRPYYILVADSMDNAKQLQETIAARTSNPFGGYYLLGAAIATNAGPTIFGAVFPV